MHIDLDQMQAAAAKSAALLKALANEARLMVLCQLTEGEKSVGQLGGQIALTQSALSQHLARLREEGLVKTRREAQTIYYALDAPEAAAILHTLYKLYCAPATERAALLAAIAAEIGVEPEPEPEPVA